MELGGDTSKSQLFCIESGVMTPPTWRFMEAIFKLKSEIIHEKEI